MRNFINKLKQIDMKYLHLTIIVLGIIFVSLSNFHSNLWFDESYSVSISVHSFKDIWTIGGNDVHPIFYYWVLHIINLIFGDNILVYRLFSVLCLSILGILGYSHIRKDFGEKIGLLFSFFVFFLPVNVVYAGEIRMYTLVMLLVTITSIYAFRIYSASSHVSIKNWIIFGICSLCSAYTHYYGLVTIGVINMFMFFYFLVSSIKSKKMSNNLKAFIICGIAQILLYIPWVLSLLKQIGQVSSSFWIYVTPDLLLELFTFYFTGNLKDTIYISIPIAIIWSLFIEIYLICLYLKDLKKLKKKENNHKELSPAILAISIFLSVILIVCMISLVIWRPIIYARYMLCAFGLFMFFMSFTIVKKGNKYINFIICTVSLLLSLYINISFININYSSENLAPFEYIREDISKDDIILVSNEGSGFIVIANFLHNTSYFYDQQKWNVEAAYKAFGDNQHTVYDLAFLDEYNGKIWVIDAEDYSLFEQVKEYSNVKLIKQEEFAIKYKDYRYAISLIEK